MSQPERGRRFWKMSGSGNDFVFFDARREPAGPLEQPDRIAALCARGTGIGADGIVFIEDAENAAFGIRYFNSDGSLASLCGNASLCSVRLAVELGIGDGGDMRFLTGAGLLGGRMSEAGPEIDLEPVRELRTDARIAPGPGEHRVGFAVAGVPHLVVLVQDVENVDVDRRGAELRRHPSLPHGANVNFVSARAGEGWNMRTFERGVEGETLACGTGAVAAAVLLTTWGAVAGPVALTTRSGRVLTVRLEPAADIAWPSLAGEGRIVFRGTLADV